MAPQLMWMESRCYRVNRTTNSDKEPPATIEPYIENGTKANFSIYILTKPLHNPLDLYGDNEYDEENETTYDIQITDNNRFKTAFHVAKYTYIFPIQN